MKLVSVNVSLGKTVSYKGQTVETGIFKEPVSGPVTLRPGGVEGDRQADLTVHGGEFKAVYAYSAEHYAWWRAELGRALPFGAFGENLTIEGFAEEEVCVGDTFLIGGALLQAVQPRLPCFKLGLRFNDPGMIKRFMQSGRFGVYFKVLRAGAVQVGDAVTRDARDPGRFPVPEIAQLLNASPRDPEKVRRLLALEALPPEWRGEFEQDS